MKLLQLLKSPDNLLNLPNLLTLIRIALIPAMAFLLNFDAEQLPFEQDWMFRFSPGRLAAIVVVIMGLTDLFDGYLARKWKIETLLGKFLDPLADKLVLMVGLIMLMKLGRVSDWLVILLLSREFLITGLRGIAVGEGIVIAAGNSGKWKLVFQLAGLGLLMWYGSLLGFPAAIVGIYILYGALGISLVSGYNYLSDFLIALRKLRQKKL
jgi:CDP-diacylglycerol--glycerol-3-phosphate 3-phosphatidyltransferase